jgi:hypothetical protein
MFPKVPQPIRGPGSHRKLELASQMKRSLTKLYSGI